MSIRVIQAICFDVLFKSLLFVSGFRSAKHIFCVPFLPFCHTEYVIIFATGLSNSPFKVMSQPGHDASKVRASGPGLDTKGVPASLPVEFTIDARDAGEGLLTVQILVGFPSFYTVFSKQ